MLISVSGIGPRAALSILSSVTPSQLALCIASGDSKALVACKGIGNKTAQRIVLELKDKVGSDDVEAGVTGSEPMTISSGVISGSESEAISALVVLGYSRSEAISAVEKVKGESSSVEDLIKEALKFLSVRR